MEFADVRAYDAVFNPDSDIDFDHAIAANQHRH